MSTEDTVTFSNPPLDEVVFGVQFNASPGYNATFAGPIWELFRSEFPVVVEQPPIPPQIEVFGGNPFPNFQLRFDAAAPRPRLWFVSPDDSHLLQHQEDRLLLNWRNRVNGTPYPRHEKMLQQFREKLAILGQFHSERLGEAISVTQAEVSYINFIPVNGGDEQSDWIKLLELRDLVDLEQITATFGTIITDESRRPIGRCFYEIQTVTSVDGVQRALRFSLTYRGKPRSETIEDALQFITLGRQRIVHDFCRLTTRDAQQFWGKQ